MRYTFRNGGDAQAVGETLETLRLEHGRLTPIAVVEIASDERSPIHKYFTWDDSTAANEYRLWEARSLIRSVTVTVEEREPVSAFVNVRADGQYYQSVEVLATNDTEYSAAVRDAGRRLASAKAGYEELQHIRDTPPTRKVLRYLGSAQAASDRIDASV